MMNNNGFGYMKRSLRRRFQRVSEFRQTNKKKLTTELDPNVSKKLSEMAHEEDMDTGPFAAELLTTTVQTLGQEQAYKITRWQRLTKREQEVAALVCKGMTNPEIAKALYISEETVKKHVSHIINKFEVKGRGILHWLLDDWNFDNPEKPWEE